MKILAPVKNRREAVRLAEEGADEIYCGVLSSDWKEGYTNISSPNRRDWTSANLRDYRELEDTVHAAHSLGKPVYLTLNTFYTENQYPLLLRQAERSADIGVDAFIVADIGLMIELGKRGLKPAIHVSTGATVFNSHAVKLYRDLGASRIILPRHMDVSEMERLIACDRGLEYEVFGLNSGCKNIDGFCTFQHGIKEISDPWFYRLLKRRNLDIFFLDLLRKIPRRISSRIRLSLPGTDSACLLNYRVSVSGCRDNDLSRAIKSRIGGYFGLLCAVDVCRLCDVSLLSDIGVTSIKIIGRNYDIDKKVRDVRFAREVIERSDGRRGDEIGFRAWVRRRYSRIYGADCRELCFLEP